MSVAPIARQDRQDRQTHPDRRADRTAPTVSVVVPVYNDPEGVTTTLESLAVQTRADFEVLVVDNESTDSTGGVARSLCAGRTEWRVLTESTPGSYAARNAGIAEARADILAFVDADMTVSPDWVARLIDWMKAAEVVDGMKSSERIDYLACAVDLGVEPADASLATRFEHRTAFPIADYVEQQGFAPTCCLAVTRRLLDAVGLFDDGLQSSGDREFGNRVRDAGYALHYAADIVLHHPPRTTVRSLVKKAIRIGRGTYQLRRRHPDRYGRPRSVVLNPLTYTPPTPGTMRASVRDWKTLPRDEQLRFYALATLLTFARARGKLQEAVSDIRHRRPIRRPWRTWPRLFR